MKEEIKQVFKTIQDLPDESVELILPQIEDEFKKMVDEQDLINKTKAEFLEQGYTVADIKTIKDSYDSIANDYFKLVSPISPKGRYISALVGVYKGILDKILKEGFSRVVNVKVVKETEDAQLPTYAHFGDAGADLYASEEIDIQPNEVKIIPTGLKVEIPDGYEIQVRPRSGMSVKTPILGILGTVDSGYRGPLGVMLYNHGEIPYRVQKGDRIAQAVITPTYHGNFLIVDSLSETERGDGGFGSSGMNDGEKA
jgi:dUTP pyrophosphatase